MSEQLSRRRLLGYLVAAPTEPEEIFGDRCGTYTRIREAIKAGARNM